MTIPDAARAASRAAVTDALRALRIPNPEQLGEVLANVALNAIPGTGYIVCPPGVEKPFPREYGTCRTCHRKFTVTLSGRLHAHGGSTGPCSGSRDFPAERIQLGRDYTLADLAAATRRTAEAPTHPTDTNPEETR